MSEPTATPADPSLQFDRAEFSEPAAAAATCAACNRALTDEYFEVNGKLLCPPCQEVVRKSLTGGSRVARLLRATAAGLVAAALGAGVYFAISKVTGYNLGLVAVLVGWMVGVAVNRGSQGRGGLGYQLLALALTYLSVAMSLAPEVAEGLAQGGNVPTTGVAYVITLGAISLAAPVLVGMEAPLSGLIYGFALWEAWRRNRRVQLDISGPFKVRTADAAGAPAILDVVPEQRVG